MKMVKRTLAMLLLVTFAAVLPVVAAGTNLLPGDSTNTFMAETFTEKELETGYKEINSGASFNNETWTYSHSAGTEKAKIYPDGSVLFSRGQSGYANLTSTAFALSRVTPYKLSFDLQYMSTSGTGSFTVNLVGNNANGGYINSHGLLGSNRYSVSDKTKRHWDIYFALPAKSSSSDATDLSKFKLVFYSYGGAFSLSNLTVTNYTGSEYVWYEGISSDIYGAGAWARTGNDPRYGVYTTHAVVSENSNSFTTPVPGKTYTVTKALPETLTAEENSGIMTVAQYKDSPLQLCGVKLSGEIARTGVTYGNYTTYFRTLILPGITINEDTEDIRVFKWNNLAELKPLA